MIRKLLALLLLVTAQTVLAQTVVGEKAGVQILRERRYDAQDLHYGYNYSALNRNSYPVYVSIRLTSSENAYDGLVPGSIIVQAGESAPLGYIVQESVSENANWNFEWKTEPAAALQPR